MKDPIITIVLCNWKHPELLKVCVNSLQRSVSVPTEIKVVLNEASNESTNYLDSQKIDYVALQENKGCVAVDLLTPLVRSPYIVTINDDQLIHTGWQNDLLDIIQHNPNCMPCVTCVEPEETGNYMVEVDNLGHVLESSTLEKFLTNTLYGKYNRKSRRGYNHPSLVKTEDWKAIGGYSCGLPFDYFGLGGYCADDYFNYNLWKRYNTEFSFVVSGKSFAYHQVSFTGKRLSPEIKNFDAHGKFVELTGMTTQQFREVIGWGQDV